MKGIHPRPGFVSRLALFAALALCACATSDPRGPGSLALVRQTEAGGVVVRYVQGGAVIGDEFHVSRDVEVSLPIVFGPDPEEAPAALTFGDRIWVARADVRPAETTISVVSSGYATTLYEAEPVVAAVLPCAIDSAVALAALEGDLLVVFHADDMLRGVRSADGASWSAVFDLHPLPAGRPFSLWHEDGVLWLAFAADEGIRVSTTLDGAIFTDHGAPLVVPDGHVRGISIAVLDEAVRLAWCDATSVYAVRADGGVFGAPAVVAAAPSGSTDYEMHAVAIHPSPGGWGLQFVAAHPAPRAIEFVVYGLRSADGLDFSGTARTYGSTTEFRGGTSMAVTPTSMPWVVKTHDSGHAADEVYNFVIACDGFQYRERPAFFAAARELTGNVVDRAPWFYHPDRFNVWVVSSCSKESGIDPDATTDSVDTIFGGRRTTGTHVLTEVNAIRHAVRMIAGDPTAPHLYGWTMFNPAEGEAVGNPPTDMSGVPVCPADARSLTPLHEYLHTDTGDIELGDHDRRGHADIVNKSADPSLDPLGDHAWQPWFVFSGDAPSRLIRTSEDYRAGLRAHTAAGEDPYSYGRSNFAYSEDPDSPFYVDALSLLNVGLWESELTDVDDLDADLLFMGLRACAMNSMLHHAQVFCPICSEIVVRHLTETAGETFDAAAFRSAPGAFLEFQVRNRNPFDVGEIMPRLELPGLIEVGGTAIDPAEVTTYVSVDWLPFEIARVDLTPHVTPGVPVTVTFRNSPGGGDTRIWLPSLQVLNGKGARYPVQPVGAALIDRLHEKHAPEIDYEYWDLAEGDLVLSFTPN